MKHKLSYGKGTKVQTGTYGAGSDGSSLRAGNGRFGEPGAVAGSHRLNKSAPKIKGRGTHHGTGKGAKKTGKAFS